MIEPTAEWLAERSDINLKLWVSLLMEELKRRAPRDARAFSKYVVLLAHEGSKSNAEPFPHLEAI